MKNTQNLKRLLEQLLNEAEPVERPKSMADFAPTEDKPVSLDQAIDRYFVQYERESIPTSEMFESNVSKLIGYLFEQDIEEPEGEDVGAGDEGGLDIDAPAGDLGLGADADPAGGEDLGFGDDATPPAGEGDDAEQPVVNTPQINLQDFTRSVARLVNNAQSLIDFRTLILNRAEAYIRSNYNERTANEMMSILDNQWDLRPESVETSSTPSSEYPQPRTAVTGPMGG